MCVQKCMPVGGQCGVLEIRKHAEFLPHTNVTQSGVIRKEFART